VVQGGVTKVGRNQNLRALFLYGVKWCRMVLTLYALSTPHTGTIWTNLVYYDNIEMSKACVYSSLQDVTDAQNFNTI
jgi:hypothetical protein